MKEILITIISVLILSVSISAQWINQTSPINEDLHSVFFINDANGWITGLTGTVLKTTDGGTTWDIKPTNTTDHLYSVYFTDENNGIAVGGAGTIFNPTRIIIKTIDGGESWSIVQSGDTTLFSVNFVNQNLGWAVGQDGKVLKTVNSGGSWSAQTVLDTLEFIPNLYSVYFIDQSTGWIGGSDRTILKTSDGGSSWMVLRTTFAHSTIYRSIFFIDENTGWTGGWDSPILKTTDGGNNWSAKGGTGDLESIYFADENTGWASYRDGIILNSTDGGETWVTQLSGINNVVSSVYFVDANTGWAVGSNGTILKTTNGGVTFVEGEEELPYKFSLKQNYPNPFNPSTKISFQLVEAGLTSLKVYDVLGNEVATLMNEEKSAGIYEVTLDGSTLTSGMYLYKLQSGNFAETKKMVLLK